MAINRRVFLGGAIIAMSGSAARAAPARPRFGTAINRKQLDDPDYAALAKSECQILVCENEMKWRQIFRKGPDPAFGPADDLARFAAENGQALRGHALFFHRALNGHWDRAVAARGAERAMEDHVQRMTQRFANVISWDVVNEALDPKAEGGDGLRKSPFHAAMGAGYIETAFRLARQYAPAAQLVLNDFTGPYRPGYFSRHRDANLRLVESLVKKGVPVDAIGLQSHLQGGRDDLDLPAWSAYLRELSGLGLKLVVTELDVADQGLDADIARRDIQIAGHAKAYLEATLAAGEVTDVISWGLVDRYSFVQKIRRRDDRLESRPLPYGNDYRAKPLRKVIADAIRAAG